MTVEQPNPTEQAALKSLVKQEASRMEGLRAQRIAELSDQIAEFNREIASIGDEYRPRIDVLNEECIRLHRETVEAAGRRDKVQREMLGKQMQVRTRRSKLDAELRKLEGRALPVPKFFERDEDRLRREKLEQELTRPVNPKKPWGAGVRR